MSGGMAFGTLMRELRDADDRTLLKIVRVIDGLAQRGGLDQLLDWHRPRLSVIRPPRPMTLARLLVLPCEALLIDGGSWSPGIMRVPRDRLGQLIGCVLEHLPAGCEAALNARLAGRTMDDAAGLLEIGRELWPAGAKAVELALRQGRRSLEPRHRELLPPLRIWGLLLPVAEPLVRTFWSLPPRPVTGLDAAARQQIVALLDVAGLAGRDCFQLVAELLIEHTELPFSIIEPVLDGAGAFGQRERQQVAAMIAETCLDNMVMLYRRLAALPATVEPELLVAPVQALVSGIESLQDVAVRVRFDHRALRQLRAELFTFIEGQLARSLLHELHAALARLDGATPSGDWRRLEKNATAVANLRLMARHVGLASKIDVIFDKAIARYQGLIAAIDPRGAGGLLADFDRMDRLRIVELLFGSPAALRMLADLRR